MKVVFMLTLPVLEIRRSEEYNFRIIFCFLSRLACEAEARHMYCFSGVGVVIVGGGSVNFLCLGHFLGNYKG